MSADVITIARTLGAGGEELGAAVADTLGFRYVDSEIITRAAELAGVDPESLVKTEGRQSLLAKVRERMAKASSESIDQHSAAREALLRGLGEVPSDTLTLTESNPGFIELITDVVADVAEQGNAVIVAHGAGVALRDRRNTLRVLVTAPAEVRASRVAETTGQSIKDAARSVAKSDADREQFFRRFYDLKTELPTHYDLVINTEHQELNSCRDAIIGLAGAG